MRLASLGSKSSRSMRASPMSGLLSAMMISSESTQFGLDFLVVQIHDRHLHSSQFVSKPQPVPSGKLGRFAQRKLPDLEEPDSQLELQFPLDLASRLAARHQ
jgi:hypothetical protein